MKPGSSGWWVWGGLLGACAGGPNDGVDDFGYEGTGIQVSIAPLTLDTLSDACYSFQVVNGADDLVVARGPSSAAAGSGDNTANALCASRFGNGDGGDVSYVAPCDSQQPEHMVTLWVDALCAGPDPLNIGQDCTEIQSYVNPCPDGCALNVTCVENADVPVTFNFTIMGQADQGFFDVAVNFDDVFCSAKLDDCYSDGSPIQLIHDPLTGERVRTAVAAVACTAGPGADVVTVLNLSKLVVECLTTSDPVFEGSWSLDFATVHQEGNLAVGPFPAGVYFGNEALSGVNKVYTTVAIGIGDNSDCLVSWSVVPSNGPMQFGAPGEFTSFGFVRFAGGFLGGEGCHQHPMDGDGSAVTTAYHPTSSFLTPAQITAAFTDGGDAFESLECENDGNHVSVVVAEAADLAGDVQVTLSAIDDVGALLDARSRLRELEKELAVGRGRVDGLEAAIGEFQVCAGYEETVAQLAIDAAAIRQALQAGEQALQAWLQCRSLPNDFALQTAPANGASATLFLDRILDVHCAADPMAPPEFNIIDCRFLAAEDVAPESASGWWADVAYGYQEPNFSSAAGCFDSYPQAVGYIMDSNHQCHQDAMQSLGQLFFTEGEIETLHCWAVVNGRYHVDTTETLQDLTPTPE